MNHLEDPTIIFRKVSLSWRSQINLLLMRYVLGPLIGFMLMGGVRRIAALKLHVASRWNRAAKQARPRFEVLGTINREIAGQVIGDLRPDGGPVLLWLHGGAFVTPIIPELHLSTAGRLAAAIDGCAFVPEYRLLPANSFPAALDDCDFAYQALIDHGYKPHQIVVGGDSAGGSMTLALLHRLKRRGDAMPACAVSVAGVTDLACFPQGSGSRTENRAAEALPVTRLAWLLDMYCGAHDRRNPELSPLYGVLARAEN